MQYYKNSLEIIGIALISISVIGLLFSFLIPQTKTQRQASHKKLRFFRSIKENLVQVFDNRKLRGSICLSVWLWFLGNYLVILLPSYAKDILTGNEGVATLSMATFSIGIGLGSLFCHALSKKIKHSSSLVKIGLYGMTFFTLTTYLLSFSIEPQDTLLSITQYFQRPARALIIAQLFFLSLFAGIYIVPLQTHIQSDSRPGECSRMISGMNILQAIGILASALILFCFFSLGLDALDGILFLFLLNCCLCFKIDSITHRK